MTVCGQSSGGSLVFALLASPASRGLLQRGISLSGSPRLNSTTAEAAAVWHRDVVRRTRCAPLLDAANHPARGDGAPNPLLADCLLSLDETELLASTPPNWHADVFGVGVFDPAFAYAPLLLVDGPGGVLPQPYVGTTPRAGRAHVASNAAANPTATPTASRHVHTHTRNSAPRA